MSNYGLESNLPPRVPQQPRGKVGVDFLWEKHNEILRRLASGETQERIAEELGISPMSIGSIKNSPLGKAQLAHLREKADDQVTKTQEKIALIAPKAAKVLESMMDDVETPQSVRAKIAMDLLDRAGLAPTKRIENTNTTTTVNTADIIELQRRLKAADIVVHVKSKQEEQVEDAEITGDAGGDRQAGYDNSESEDSNDENEESYAMG